MENKGFYNAALKQEFIESKSNLSAEDLYVYVFKKTAILEEPLDKDVCNFSLGEIADLMSVMGCGSLGSLESRISVLRSYTQFCLAKNQVLDGQNHFDEVTKRMCMEYVDSVKQARSYISKQEVYSIVDRLPNAKDKYLVLAPYEGIYGKNLCELIELTTDDILPDCAIKTCTGRVLPVTLKLYEIIVEAGNTYEYFSPDEKSRKLKQSNLIYKPIESVLTADKANSKQLNVKLAKLKQYIDDMPVLGVGILKRSGFYNGLYELSLKYSNLQFNDMLKQPEVKEWCNRYEINQKSLALNTSYFKGHLDNFIRYAINEEKH